MPIDVQDGRVARSPSAQENKEDLMAIKSFIAIRKVASFVVPPAGNGVAMNASSNALEPPIAAWHMAKEGDVA